MKYFLLLISSLFLYSIINAQAGNQIKSILTSADTSCHKINTKNFQYNKTNPNLFSYSPLQKVKFTFSTGFNNSMFIRVNKDYSKSGEFQYVFNDLDAHDVIVLLKYDARIKFYINKRWRFLIKAQVLGAKKDTYSAGFSLKI